MRLDNSARRRVQKTMCFGEVVRLFPKDNVDGWQWWKLNLVWWSVTSHLHFPSSNFVRKGWLHCSTQIDMLKVSQINYVCQLIMIFKPKWERRGKGAREKERRREEKFGKDLPLLPFQYCFSQIPSFTLFWRTAFSHYLSICIPGVLPCHSQVIYFGKNQDGCG